MVDTLTSVFGGGGKSKDLKLTEHDVERLIPYPDQVRDQYKDQYKDEFHANYVNYCDEEDRVLYTYPKGKGKGKSGKGGIVVKGMGKGYP